MYKREAALSPHPDGLGGGGDEDSKVRLKRQVEMKKIKGTFGAKLVREGRCVSPWLQRMFSICQMSCFSVSFPHRLSASSPLLR